MTAARYPADSHEGRILLALRAGTLETTAFYERFASPQYVRTLVKKGLVEQTSDGSYRLTPAGRAACPWRNPLAAPGARPTLNDKPLAKETDMKLTRAAVLETVVAAGPAGITRAELCQRFADFGENATDIHVSTLNKEGDLFKPKRGLLVAAAFAGEHLSPGPVPAVPVFADLRPGPIVAPPPDPAAPRYAVAFPSDFSATVEEAVARALGNYEWASLKDAVVISCTPLGGIAAGFVPFAASRP